MKKWIIALMSLLLTASVWAQDYIPARAYELQNIVKSEIDRLFPTLPRHNYIPALIEHESCVTLRSKRCWSSLSQLKTQREEGGGVGQLTRAYNKDGSLRFDSLADMRNRYRKELAELDWKTIYQKPDMQVRAIVLMTRDNYNKLYDVKNPYHRLSMTNAAYNGGLGGVQRERRQCSLIKGCNPDVWFGNVSEHCMKSKKVLYGNRSACDINRYHSRAVMLRNLPKYEKFEFIPL